MGAGWLPGLPHILHKGKSPSWDALRVAFADVAEDIARSRADILLLYSTQWLSVLGTSVQARPLLEGVHVDENWHEWGDLPFRFRTHPELAGVLAGALRPAYPARTVDYEGFPVDTGTILAVQGLGLAREMPVIPVSSWVYADAAKSTGIGALMARAIETADHRAYVVVSSLLSAGYFTTEIDPAADRFGSVDDEKWCRSVVTLLEGGNWAGVTELAGANRSVKLDMQFNGFHFLRGALGSRAGRARCRSLGPVWGTGAAVMHFDLEG